MMLPTESKALVGRGLNWNVTCSATVRVETVGMNLLVGREEITSMVTRVTEI